MFSAPVRSRRSRPARAEVVFVPDRVLGPLFGLADPERRTVYVRRDLPAPVRDFVLAHECYHLKDRARWWAWREIKADMAGALAHPVGFVLCLALSLRRNRLALYWRRICLGR